jgi:hypothetical protein
MKGQKRELGAKSWLTAEGAGQTLEKEKKKKRLKTTAREQWKEKIGPIDSDAMQDEMQRRYFRLL